MRYQTSVIALLVATPALIAAAFTPLSLQPGSRVWVEGTSTARSYRCESTRVQGSVDASTTDLAQLSSVPGAQITVPVATLDCRNGTMNGHMRNALQATQNPNIRLQASAIRVNNGTARITGDLTIAGRTQPVTIDATVAAEDGQLRVRGSRTLNMTNYGVRPPSLMLGAMRVNPNVTVGFDVLLRP